MPKRNVRFLYDHTVQDAEGKTYEKGKTYSMNDDSVLHYVRRGLAEEVNQTVKAAK
jgi:hypothetical protein